MPQHIPGNHLQQHHISVFWILLLSAQHHSRQAILMPIGVNFSVRRSKPPNFYNDKLCFASHAKIEFEGIPVDCYRPCMSSGLKIANLEYVVITDDVSTHFLKRYYLQSTINFTEPNFSLLADVINVVGSLWLCHHACCPSCHVAIH